MGDAGRLLLLEAVLKVIERDNLLKLVKESGDLLMDGLKQLQNKYPSVLSNLRGHGTFISVDCPSAKVRDHVIERLRMKGRLLTAFTNNYSLCKLRISSHTRRFPLPANSHTEVQCSEAVYLIPLKSQNQNCTT